MSYVSCLFKNTGNKAKQLKSVVFPVIGLQTGNSSIKRKPHRDVSSGQVFNKSLTLRRLGIWSLGGIQLSPEIGKT